MAVIRGTGDARRRQQRRRRIIIKKAGHPGAFRKMRCPKCSLGYAIASNTDLGKYQCGRCGHEFILQAM